MLSQSWMMQLSFVSYISLVRALCKSWSIMLHVTASTPRDCLMMNSRLVVNPHVLLTLLQHHQLHLRLQRQPAACSLQRLAPTGQPLATWSLRLRCSHLPSATRVYAQPFQQRRRSVNSDSHFSDDSDSPSRSLALAAKNATRFLWCFSNGNLCS